jgi:hypothetical protein
MTEAPKPKVVINGKEFVIITDTTTADRIYNYQDAKAYTEGKYTTSS